MSPYVSSPFLKMILTSSWANVRQLLAEGLMVGKVSRRGRSRAIGARFFRRLSAFWPRRTRARAPLRSSLAPHCYRVRERQRYRERQRETEIQRRQRETERDRERQRETERERERDRERHRPIIDRPSTDPLTHRQQRRRRRRLPSWGSGAGGGRGRIARDPSLRADEQVRH